MAFADGKASRTREKEAVGLGCYLTILLLSCELNERLKAVGTTVFIVGRYEGGEFSSGVDDAAAFARLPKTFAGGVWTNRIEEIGQLARRQPGL